MTGRFLNRPSWGRRGRIRARRGQLALTACTLLAGAACASTPHRAVPAAARPPAATTTAATRPSAATAAPRPFAATATTRPPAATAAPRLSVATKPAPAPTAADVAKPPAPPAASRVRAAVLTALGSATASVDVAVVDLTTGQDAHLGRATPVRAASLTKLLIYLAAARTAPVVGPAGRTARAMIVRSDNDAATTLWRQAGGDPAVAGVVTAIGMTRTARVRALLEPWDGWVTTAEDQLRLLRHIHAGDVRGGAQLRALMGEVVSDQDWGAGRVPATTGRFVKNGWLPVGQGSWVVISDGCMTADNGDAVCVAVTSTGSPTMAAGVATVQAVASAAVQSIVVR